MPKIEITESKGLVQLSGGGDTAFGLKSVTAGAGLTSTDTQTLPQTRVSLFNDEVVTTITLNLKGLDHSNGAADIIGKPGSPAYLLQYKTATHGILHKAEISCLSIPTAGSNPVLDFDIISDDEGTLVEDETPHNNNVSVYVMGANLATGKTVRDSALGQPVNDQFLYLCVGAAPGGASTHTGGKLVIRLFGHKSF
jgi:hypothetical protein